MLILKWNFDCFVSQVKKPVHMYISYHIYLPKFHTNLPNSENQDNDNEA
jgi:hypothetical protein